MHARKLPLLLCVWLLGCSLEPAGDTESKPDGRTPPIASIASEMRAARLQSLQQLRDSLTQIADDVEAGRIEYDTKLELELHAAASRAAEPINAVKLKYLPTGKITDRKSAATTLRQIRDGYQ